MLTFAICDDEPLMAQSIADQLSAYMAERGTYRTERFPDGRSLLESGGGFDVIFLDVQMERPDGMETARLLRRQGNRSLLIFVTVLRECVFDAFEVGAFDYLIKPLDAGRFRGTMDRALQSLERRPEKSLVVRRGTAREVVPLAEIVYCEVRGRKVYLHRSGGEIIDYYDKLEDLERRVDGRFFKCHRSYLVNLDYVRGSRDGQVVLPEGEAIPVSRLRERDLTEALLRCMKERGP